MGVAGGSTGVAGGSTGAADGRVDNVQNKVYSMKMRTSPDIQQSWPWGYRPHQCDSKLYPVAKLANTSVIITFHDKEKLSHVLHTVHSVVQMTPRQLLKEIILVDDFSKKDDFKKVLDNYIDAVFYDVPIRLLRSTEPLGLIRARLWGIQEAHGDVVVCMDSHMEVQKQWLEPLLNEIHINPKTLASSYLDWMQQKDGNWSYKHGSSSWKTYFDWSFTFGFQDISTEELSARSVDPTEPMKCPVTVGTLFAISKSWFREVGEFDPGMEGWGGENIDLPLRVWLFGGHVVNVPCSHAAHLEEVGQRNYRYGQMYQMQIYKNYKRVALTWLDEYEDHFIMYNPSTENIDVGDITDRQELRHNAKHNFSWFKDNVFPELGTPDHQTFAFGQLKTLGMRPSNMCLNALLPNNPSLQPCNGYAPTQGFFWNIWGELRFPMHVFNAKSLGDEMILVSEEYTSQYRTEKPSRWLHYKGGPMTLYPSNMCLQVSPDKEIKLTLQTCNSTNPFQSWEFGAYTSNYIAAQKANIETSNTELMDSRLVQRIKSFNKAVLDLLKWNTEIIQPQTVKDWWSGIISERNRLRALTGARPDSLIDSKALRKKVTVKPSLDIS